MSLVNHIAIVVDESGSMDPLVHKVAEMYNRNVDTIREQTYKGGQNTTVTLVTFASSVKEKFFNADVTTLKRLKSTDFNMDGTTKLYDAVGHVIEKFNAMDDANDPDVSFMVIVLTDGYENCSRNYSSTALAKAIRQCQSTDRWTFAFMVPPGSKDELVRKLGLFSGNVTEWEFSEHGAEQASMQTRAGLGSYFQSRSMGLRSVQTFYTDLSKVKPSTVKKKLDDISSDVKVWTVEAETDIKSFCESKSKHGYLKGAAFYALTKTEKIQPYKQILIMEKNKKAVYAGEDARTLLGLPETEEVRVKPGNHANYDIYVQSTSVNRKLVRGTKLVYAPKLGSAY